MGAGGLPPAPEVRRNDPRPHPACLPRSLFRTDAADPVSSACLHRMRSARGSTLAREQAVRTIGEFAVAQRIANLSRLLDESSADRALANRAGAQRPDVSQVSLASNLPGAAPS